MTTHHTPTPWRTVVLKDKRHRMTVIMAGGSFDKAVQVGCCYANHVSHEEAAANAAFIVRAVNSHDALVEALGPTLNAKSLKLVTEHVEVFRAMGDIGLAIALEMLLKNHAKRVAALALAKGEK